MFVIFLVLLQLQFTWCAYIASAIGGIGGTSYNTDASSVTSAIPTSVPSISPSLKPSNYPSLSPSSISIISTIAGTGTAGYSGDNGQATAATVYGPSGIAVDSNGNVYFSDYNSCRVRKIAISTGVITTYAGTGTGGYSGDGGAATSALIKFPFGLCIDTSGNLYIADWNNNRIRKVTASTSVISTIVGTGTASYSGDNSQATSATLYYPGGVAVDTSGNVYIGDSGNNRIRKITASTGVITTIAGTGVAGYSGDGGAATSAAIKYPCGINLDNAGNVYFGDETGYNVIRKVTVSTGVISTVAGTGSTSGGYNGDNIQATSAMLYYPNDVVLDSYGNLYISDRSNNRVRKVDVSTGVITTVVGTGTYSSTGDGGAATSATMKGPCFTRFDSSGNYYISEQGSYGTDYGSRIRKVTTVTTDIPSIQPTYYPSLSPHSISVISTIAGTGTASYSGDGGQATVATLNVPVGIAIDTNKNVYVSEFSNHRVRKITASTGIITTYAGIGASSYSGDNGVASSAAFNSPLGLCMDTSDNLYIVDCRNHRIRKVLASTSVITTIAGTGASSYSGDNGVASSASLYYPAGVAVDNSGNVYISDTINNRVRKILASTSVITTIAGTGASGYSGDNGQATSAMIMYPHGINLDTSGNIYFGDYTAFNVIRKVTVSTGIISTVAGTGSTTGSYNGDNIQATAATLNYPYDVVLDSYNNLYISDRYNNRVRKVDVSTGVITTVVGTGTASSTGDGSAATSANTKGPCFSRFDSSGNYYISECEGNRVRKVITVSTDIPTAYPSLSPHSISVISTIAGTGTASYSGDGSLATSAELSNVFGIDLDSSGNVYVSDWNNHRVRKITVSTGIITTYAGTGASSYSGDGGAASSAALNNPVGLCIDTSGNVYIADEGNHRIRKVTASTGKISTVAGTGATGYNGDNGQATSATIYYPLGVAVDYNGNVYIGDYGNNRVRKVSASTSAISTIAGTGTAGYSGDNGQATAAKIKYPYGVNLDSSLNVYFGDFNAYNVIRKVTVSTGVISTVAGTGSTTGSYNGDNIQATAATLNYPNDIVLDSYGNLYISDRLNYRVRKVTVSTGVITTVVGTGTASSTGDGGAASLATINGPVFSRFDSSGNYYISDCAGNRVRKVITVSTDIPTSAPSYSPSATPTFVPSTSTPSRSPTYYPSLSPHSISVISTIAGTGTGSYSGDNGQATSATVNTPTGLVFDSNGNVYFNDYGNNRVRKITVSTGIITTYAGTGSTSYSGDGGVASSAALYYPNGLCTDSSGNLYITEQGSHRIRKVLASTSVISTIAGTGTTSFSGDNGQATSATLYYPAGVAVDILGNVYIGDSSNHRVRKVKASTGIITTIAGTGVAGFSGDGGAATAADIKNPAGINLDSNDNVYFGDHLAYNVIRKITVSNGVISTVVGTGSTSGGYNGDNIQATTATLNSPHNVVLDSYGNLYISDRANNRVRKVDVSTGFITTVVGTGTASSTGDGSAATSATVKGPCYSRFDSSGNFYISECEGHRVRKVVTVTTDIPTSFPSLSPHSISVISTIAGTGTASYSGDNGQATSAAINGPTGIVIDTNGNVYFNDFYNHRVRKITTSTGIITTYAGTGTASYSGDNGVATSAALNSPNGLGIDSSGNVYIADCGNHRIRKVLASTSVISTIAGTGSTSFTGDNGLATSATLNYPIGVAVDTSGNVYIGDYGNHRVRKITASTGVITTIAGTGTAGFSGDNGQATAANIKSPCGVNLDSSLNVYFGDQSAYNVIRKVTVSTGVIITVAGTGSTTGEYNGDSIQATAATLNSPVDVIFDSYNNLYISDRYNNRIRKVDVSTGVITTVVGTGTASSSGDGSAATSATIKGPSYSRFDSSGNYYISECDGNRVRKVITVSTEIPTTTPSIQPTTATPSRSPTYYPSLSPHSISVISTIAGTGTASYSGDNGQATSATMNGPHGIAIDSSGNVFIGDGSNYRVRKITASTGIITNYAGTGTSSYSGDNGAASSAGITYPHQLSVDSSGNLYITDYYNHRIRKVTTSTSVISTIAGTGASSYSGDNGLASSAALYLPAGVAVDTSGNMYIGDCYNHRIRKITASTGVITTIAGTGVAGFSGDNGQATAATIKYPAGINLDSAGNFYFGDRSGNNVIRKVTISTGVISTVAGTGSASGAFNGDNIQATAATLNSPLDVVLDSYNNLYISETGSNRIRKVTVSTGVITTVVGTGTASSTGDGSTATSATINGPKFSRFDSAGNLYLCEGGGNKVRKVITVTTDIPTAAPSIQPTYYPSLSPHSVSVISTIVGTGSAGYSGDNGQATLAAINTPTGIALDASGNVYFSDFNNHRVRKITVATGIITTYAGTGTSSYSGDNGVASSATLSAPNGLCIDTSGNLYIADFYNHRIRKVTMATNVISTVAGTGTASFSGDNGPATSATLYYPLGVAVDTSGNVYIGDHYNHRVRKISASTSVITTIAGTGTYGYSGDGGAATAAAIAMPTGVDLDNAGNVYISDVFGFNVIRKVTVSTGVISTVAGIGSTSGAYNGDNRQATSAALYYPFDVALDSYNNLYIAERGNNRIRKVDASTGVITTVAGTGTGSSTGDGSAVTSATLNGPCYITFDSSGNYYISECGANSVNDGYRVRKVMTVTTDIPTPAPTIQPTYYPSLSPHSISVISTIAGTGAAGYSGDNGAATSATIHTPTGIAIDSSGNVYFNDWNNDRVRKITVSTGIITTYAGTGTASYSGDGGAATSAALNSPYGLCMDTSGNLYIADINNQRIRKVLASSGVISTIIGTGTASFSGDNGQATSAALYQPLGVAVDTLGNVYIGDYGNHRIRKITASTTIVSTIAGTGTSGYSGDGGAATAAMISNPAGVNLDNSGNVYFGDVVGYNVIRKVTVSTGVISTVAGTGSTSGGYNLDNIQATAATLYYPMDVVLDSAGNLYICDRNNYRIRKVDASTGVITTIVGTGTYSSTGDGGAATAATIKGACASRFDSAGNYYISDCGAVFVDDGYRVRKVMTVTTDIPTPAPSMQPTYYPSLSPHSISVISTIAGTGTAGYSGDNGPATSATINTPHGIAIDSSGNVYFNDYWNNRVRKITVSSGIITTYAGTGASSYSGDGAVATSAALCRAFGLSIDSSGNLFIADSYNQRIRKVLASTSVISTVAGTGTASFSGDNGLATSATLNYPAGIAVDTSGNVYIGDWGNNRVRKITASTSVITTIAGIGTTGYSGDNGQATAAAIGYPHGVNLDSSGNVYFGDNSYNVIRKITVSTGVISTVAGTGSTSGGYSGDNAQATAAKLNYPTDVVLDSYNNLYISDRHNYRVRKVDVSTGVITTVVGTGTSSSTGDGGAATSATIKGACFCRFDSSGNYYISECGAVSVDDGNRIRKVMTVTTDIPTPAPSVQPTYYPSLSPHSISLISTIAGTGTASYSGDGGQATAATFSSATGIVIDSNGNVFFNDFGNNRVRKITSSTGIITTYAGSGTGSYSGDNGAATSAAMKNPFGLCIDSSGNLYIADCNNHRIRKVAASTSVISTIAGTGASSYSGDNGQATSAALYQPVGVAVDTSGNVYIGDMSNHRVRKITASTSVITTIAGTGSAGFSGDGSQATAALIKKPCGVNLDNSFNVYFGDCDGYNVIRKITVSTGIVSTVAGNGGTGYSGDNIHATSATLNYPNDVVLDSSGNLYISDRFNYRIRKVDVSTGVISTVVGTGSSSSTGDGSVASSATLNGPCFSRFDSSGNYYISECEGSRVRKVITVSTDIPSIQPTYYPSLSPHSISVITTFAGTGAAGYSGDGGQATSATLYGPDGIAIDSSGNVYFSEYSNHCVRKITASTGIITTYAGTGSSSYSGDGGVATSAGLYHPIGVYLDSSDNLYIADSFNHRVRKVLASTTVISTIAGDGSASYSGDNGQATNAALYHPVGVVVDTSGNVYIGDSVNHRVRKILASTGVITTIAGTGVAGFSGDNGQATSANIKNPHGVNLDSSLNVYFGDWSAYNVIRKVTVSTGLISTVAGSGSTSGGYSGDNVQATVATLNNPYDVVLDSYGNLYVSDRSNYRIRKVTISTGVITTVVGTGTASSTGDGSAATSATINGPCFSRFDSTGNYYITECEGHRVRKVVTVTTDIPTAAPSYTPSIAHTQTPTFAPSNPPSKMPSVSPSRSPTMTPSTSTPTVLPSMIPSVTPTHTPSTSPSEYPTYLNGVEVYFTVTQLFYNVSYSLYAADKAVNDALIIDAVVVAIGYDLRETDVTVISTSKQQQQQQSRTLLAATDTLSMSYYIDSVSYIFADSDTATQVYMQALEAAIANGTFSHLLYEYAISKNSTLVSSTYTTAVLNTAGPTSSPSSSPTTSPTKAPVNLLGTNILSAELTSEVVQKKTNYYLAYYLAYFLCIYVLLYLFSFSRLGVDAATRLYESAYESGNFSKCTSELVAAPENNEVNYVLRAIYERNQRVHDTLIAEAALLKIKSVRNEDIEDENEAKLSKTQSSRRVSFNSRLLNIMLKNKEKFSAAFQEYIMQRRTLLGSSGILFPNGYSMRLCGRTYTFPVGVMENLLLFVCINHALFNCFYYVKGSKLGRHGTKLVYICREIVVFVLSQFVGLVVEYLGISGTGSRIFTNVFIVVPLAQSIGMFLVYIYTCPCADSIEFQSKYTRLHGYLLLLGRIALIPILLLIFLSLVVACIFSTSTQRGRIIASYLLNVQILGVVQLLVTCALRFIDDYYFEVLVYRYRVISVGGMYLERIVHHNLKNEVDFTAKKVRWLCGLVTVLTINAGGSSTTHHEEKQEMEEEEDQVIEEESEYVAIEMTTHSPLIEHDDDNSSPAVGVEDVVEAVQQQQEEEESDYVDYGNIYNTETNEEVVQYNDMAAVRISVQHDQKSKLPAPAAAKIDVDNMSLADLLKQYKLERVQQQDNKAGHDVDDRLFEEWKMSKRKQFKEGTRSAFVDAYNTYEDLFSKTTYQSTKGKEAMYGVTVNPLLAAGHKATTTTGDQQSADSSMDSAAHTKMLFKQQTGKAGIPLDHKYKKK